MAGDYSYVIDTFFTPIKHYMDDDTVTEVMINGHEEIWIERSGRLIRVEETFATESALMAAINNIAEYVNRHISTKYPIMDARLPDGSRVHAIIPPVARIGPCMSIRKFSEESFGTDDYLRFGTFTRQMAFFLGSSVLGKKNIVIAGGTGTGKTSLLGYVANFIPGHERIILIEDASELRLDKEHVVPLETRPPDLKGEGEITIRDLMHSSLRMRPDRVIVGECRGEETLDMLQSMTTGHAGSLTTVHASTPADAILRLETMCLMAGIGMPLLAIRAQVASAVDLVVQVERLPNGSRKIVAITEVLGLDANNNIQLADIFVYDITESRFRTTGHVPTFIKKLKAQNPPVPDSLFEPT